MCGRFQLSMLEKDIRVRFNVDIYEDSYRPRFNCAPSQSLAVITNENPKELSFFKWGLIPFWAKDYRIGNKLINARRETVDEKASFKQSFKRKRCLVPANGFYEWKRNGKEKTPFRFFLKNEEPFAMAGLWDVWKDAEGRETRSFTIVTTKPNKLMEPVHNRMPVILQKESETEWLENDNINGLKGLLIPFPEDLMVREEVSQLVNSTVNDSPELVLPVNKLF